MLEIIPGYQVIEEIYETAKIKILRAVHKVSGQRVVIKTISTEYPTIEEIQKLQHEYHILHSLDVAGVIRAQTLVRYKNKLALILEDFGGRSLADLNMFALPRHLFFKLSYQLIKVLQDIHAANIIHKDIKPKNILWNPQEETLKLIDFGIASQLTRGRQMLNPGNLLQGSLAYISPEQTGRMNREIDYRTDYYSLGITLYQLLTGFFPFHGQDDMEWIHHHIAKIAHSPCKVRPEIPKMLGEVVLKLIAKNAEERYQSIFGLQYDLQKCEILWAKGQDQEFQLGSKDISRIFRIPQKLYGRQPELESLRNAFHLIRSEKQNKALVLVRGSAGLGKTVLIHEMRKHLLEKKGYFILGKFYPLQKERPYSAISDALQQLVAALLREGEEKIEYWRQQIKRVLGDQGKIMTDLVPDLELLIGEQPRSPTFSAMKADKIFHHIFLNFFNLFARKDHPLVLMLDDLQWADQASLQLLQLLLEANHLQALLVIGTYPTQELEEKSPLRAFLQRTGSHPTTQELVLQRMDVEETNELIAATLFCPLQRSKELAQLVQEKTNGNQFFVHQFLAGLYQEKLLEFDTQQGIWDWDTEAIQLVEITDNVIELMIRKIRGLPTKTQQLLKKASCIGNEFSLDILTQLHESTYFQCMLDLDSAIKAGLIYPLKGGHLSCSLYQGEKFQQLEEFNIHYRFLHNRIHRAAYSLNNQESSEILHHKLGWLLQDSLTSGNEAKIYEIVQHFNLGSRFIESLQAKIDLAQLNLTAGRKAKASVAYESAEQFFRSGMKHLPADSWNQLYPVTFALHIELAESLYLQEKYNEAEFLFQQVFKKTKGLKEKGDIYTLQVALHLNSSQDEKALRIGLEGLKLFGIYIPEFPTDRELAEENLKMQRFMEGRTLASLLELPRIKADHQETGLKLLMIILSTSYFSRKDLFLFLVLRINEYTFQHGNGVFSAIGYSFYGVSLCLKGDIQGGKEWGQLALDLTAQADDSLVQNLVSIIWATCISPWHAPLQDSFTRLHQGDQSSKYRGSLTAVTYGRNYELLYRYFTGIPLSKVQEDIQQATQGQASYFFQLLTQVIKSLQGETLQKGHLSSQDFQEQQFIRTAAQATNPWLLNTYYLLKIRIAYMFGHYQEVIKLAEASTQLFEGGSHLGIFLIAEVYLFHALGLIALYPQQSQRKQESSRTFLGQLQQQLSQWTQQNPHNFQAKSLLIDAELAALQGGQLLAMDLYEEALQAADRENCLPEKALIAEQATAFYQKNNKERIANTYLQEAWYNYHLWENTAKTCELEEQNPHFKFRSPKDQQESMTLGTEAQSLDLMSVMKTAQVISGEIVLKSLLSKIMKILIENAGAESGCLLLSRKQNSAREEGEGCNLMQQFDTTQYYPEQRERSYPQSITDYVLRTQKLVILNDAVNEGAFREDPVVKAQKIKSILCLPISHRQRVMDVLYLENNLTTGAFTEDRFEVLRLLASQVAISIENAQLYQEMEQRVQARTLELDNSNKALVESLETLQKTQAQLIQSERLASLGSLVAGVAHEINTPLGIGITGSSSIEYQTQLIFDRLENNQLSRREMTEFLKDTIESASCILNNLTKAGELIAGFKQVAVDQSSELIRTFNLRQYVGEILLSLQPKLRKTRHLVQVEIPEDLEIHSYPGAFSQILTNLIMNSLIHGFEKMEQGEIIIKAHQIDQQLIFQYRDNGKGVDPRHQKQIFDPFFTTRRGQGGTGLGMHIVFNQITLKLDGKIQLSSKLGAGIAINITIPLISKELTHKLGSYVPTDQ